MSSPPTCSPRAQRPPLERAGISSRGDAPPVASLRAFLDGELVRHRGSGKTVVVSVPAPLAAPESILENAPAPAFLWAPPSGPRVAALGSSHRIELDGPARLRDLRLRSDELWRRIVAVDHPACEPPEPRLFGGLAFEAGWASEGMWSGFGDGFFTLPRWRYSEDGTHGSLGLALEPEGYEDGEERQRHLDRFERLYEELRAASEEPPQGTGSFIAVREPEITARHRQEWQSYVEAIRRQILQGYYDKIVAARIARLELQPDFDPAAVLSRLAVQMPTCTRFAFVEPEGTFLGATPERLVHLRGARIETEALAGSIARGAAQAQRLLASAKDQHEHALVVCHIVERLRPLCERLRWSREAGIRELRNVLHLETPIQGDLHPAGERRGKSHVLELVERLHPTPAVGGVPAKEAVRFIVEHEPVARGWYAGPIGWFNASGDGEFSVALRCCLIEAARAFLYLGAGIVRESDPELELAETVIKQRAMLEALGIGP